MCEISCVLPFNSKNFLKIIAGKIQINLHKLHFLKFWFWESSNETQRTCFWVIFDLLNYGCCSVAHSCPVLCDPPWTAAHRPFLSFTISWSLLKCMSIEPVMPSNHLILCHPLLLLPSIFPSIRVFSNESVLHISFSISPSNEYSGLISFRIDWMDLLTIQGTLKSLLQHHSSKASILQPSAIFIVQLSHPYMTTGKTIALTRWTFVGKVMSLLFNMLPRFNMFSK